MVDHSYVDRIIQQDFHIIGSYTFDPVNDVVNVNGSVVVLRLHNSALSLNFGKVSGDFSFHKVYALETLAGSPHTVGGHFDCSRQALKSLEHAPRQVGSMDCSENQLTSLANAPTKCDLTFNCAFNIKLINLEGAPASCTDLLLTNCDQIISLKGAPRTIPGRLVVSQTSITNFEHAPEQVGSLLAFGCYELEDLTSLPHIAHHVSMIYKPSMPLLKLLTATSIQLGGSAPRRAAEEVEDILNKYAGQGKAGAIKCAGELVKAGYKDNARW